MSVVNKMLRDLDQRAQQQAPPPPGRQLSSQAVTRGTAIIDTAPDEPVRRPRRRPAFGIWAALLAVFGAAGAWWIATAIDRLPTMAPTVATPAVVAPSPVPAPSVMAATSPSLASSLAPADAARDNAPAVAAGVPMAAPAPPPGFAQLPQSGTKSAPPATPAALSLAAQPGVTASPSAPATASSVAKAEFSLPAAGRVIPPRGETVAAASVPVEPAPAAHGAGGQPSRVPVQAPAAPIPWQDAAMEAVGQAQRLWNAGSRDAAIDQLREALALLERTRAVEMSGVGSAVSLALLRELVRMELAQGNLASVLALTKRLQWVLAGQADLWALRANAAQRLGQHAESSQAYLMALKIRPGEPRWMLGAAVSLAAQGQLAAAAELAEQARALGPVSPEILVYLRQLGVPLVDR